MRNSEYDRDMEPDRPRISVAPTLLVAMPQMTDPNFRRAVVLLCEYTGDGAFGIVINRPMDEPAHEVVQTQPPVEINREQRLWIGGPVEPERSWVLLDQPTEFEDETRLVAPGIYLSASGELARRLLQQPPQPRARVIVGYAGWGPGQLDRELAASAWLTADAALDLVFDVPAARVWETTIRRLGADPASLQASGRVH